LFARTGHSATTSYLNPKIVAAAGKITVKASRGAMKLSGLLPGEALVRAAVETSRALPEVAELDTEWLGTTEAAR